MFSKSQASIAVFSYRQPPEAGFAAIVESIDAVLQNTDTQPRKIRWFGSNIALIDRIGIRIALGYLPPSQNDVYAHLVLSIGDVPDNRDDGILTVSTDHLTDKLVNRIKEDLPYDLIMRGESPDEVTEELIEALFDLLRQMAPSSKTDTSPDAPKAKSGASHGQTQLGAPQFDVIHADELNLPNAEPPAWLTRRAETTDPLRLTVHTVALSVMLYTPPLGAFLFTYSMLRDIADTQQAA